MFEFLKKAWDKHQHERKLMEQARRNLDEAGDGIVNVKTGEVYQIPKDANGKELKGKELQAWLDSLPDDDEEEQ